MAAKRRTPTRMTIPLGIGRGMWSGGDAATIPDGYARRLRNLLRRPDTWTQRPHSTHDALAAIRGLGTWQDSVTGARRLIALNSVGAVFVKAASGEAYTSGGTAVAAADLIDSASYRGEQILLGGTGAHVPGGVFSYNGTTTENVYLSGNAETQLYPATVAIFKERAVYAGATLSFINWLYQTFGTDYSYNAANWTRTNVTAATIAAGSETLCRITPTSTTASSMRVPAADMLGNVGLSKTDIVRWHVAARNTSATYRMPLTFELRYGNAWATSTVVTVGNVIVPSVSNGLRYRAIAAGTTDAATEPAWPTNFTPFADGSVTWINDGSDVAAAIEATLQTASSTTEFEHFEVVATIASGANAGIYPNWKFGTTGVGTITLAAVDFSLKDGRTDGDPKKRNHGQQVTTGHFAVPFLNRDSPGNFSPDPTDTIYLSEVGDPSRVLANSTYRTTDVAGPLTVVRAMAGKLLAFKRSAAYVFAATVDPRIPILPEGDARVEFGCLGPKAFAAFEDRAYIVSEHEVFRWVPGENPVPLCGDAMREEIMNKSPASWCESQAAPCNRALLAVDPKNREVWVYTQKGKLFVYNIDVAAWSVIDFGGDGSVAPVGYEICDMIYNPNTGNMYFAFATAASGTPGLVRLDPNVEPAQDAISDSGTLPVHAEIWPRPIEIRSPAADVLVDTVRVYHKITADQTGQTTTGLASFDQGATFERSIDLAYAPAATGSFSPLQYPVYQTWNSLQIRFSHIGKGGAANFTVSRIEAEVNITGGYMPKTLATGSNSTL